MKIWTTEEEAEKLKARFAKVNRAAFARDHNLKGDQAMIYQHITGRRPISLEAALVYAKGFGCNLEDISPRLALEVTGAAAKTGGSPVDSNANESPKTTAAISNIEKTVKVKDLTELIELFLSSDDEERANIIDMARSIAGQRTSAIETAANDNP